MIEGCGFGCYFHPHDLRPSHGTRLNSRELTAILYANPTDWDLEKESWLIYLIFCGFKYVQFEESLGKGGQWIGTEDGGALQIYLNSEDLEEAPGPEHPKMELKPTTGTLVSWIQVVSKYDPSCVDKLS